MDDYEFLYHQVVAEVEAVVRSRNSGGFAPILPKLKAIVNEHSDEPVFPAT